MPDRTEKDKPWDPLLRSRYADLYGPTAGDRVRLAGHRPPMTVAPVIRWPPAASYDRPARPRTGR